MSVKLLGDEELLRLQINELAAKIQSYNDRRDTLIGKAVAIETRGMNYTEQKAFSLGIRWYYCKDKDRFSEGYREVAGYGN